MKKLSGKERIAKHYSKKHTKNFGDKTPTKNRSESSMRSGGKLSPKQEGMKKLLNFINIYSNNFIEKVWHDNPHLTQHLRQKFNNSKGEGREAIVSWISSLDAENSKKLFEYIENNYKQGGSTNGDGKVEVKWNSVTKKTWSDFEDWMTGKGKIFTIDKAQKLFNEFLKETGYTPSIKNEAIKMVKGGETGKVKYHINRPLTNKEVNYLTERLINENQTYWENSDAENNILTLTPDTTLRDKRKETIDAIFTDALGGKKEYKGTVVKMMESGGEAESNSKEAKHQLRYAAASGETAKDFVSGLNGKSDYKEKAEKEIDESNQHIKNAIDTLSENDNLRQGGNINAKQLSEMVQGYLSAILFAESDNEEAPLDQNYSIQDFNSKSLADINSMVGKYISYNKEAIDKSGLENDIIGMDIWYAQAGHGAGFFDHSLDKDIEDQLTKTAQALGEYASVEVGDDGKIHVRGINKSIAPMKEGGRTSKRYGVYVYGQLHDDFSDELLADASAHALKSIHPAWKIEVKPVKGNKMENGGEAKEKEFQYEATGTLILSEQPEESSENGENKETEPVQGSLGNNGSEDEDQITKITVSENNNTMKHGGKIPKSKEKKTLEFQINSLKQSLDSPLLSAATKQKMADSISEFQARLDGLNTKISLKEKMALENGKQFLKIPTSYKERMYHQLRDKGVKVKWKSQGADTKVIVDNQSKLNKVYDIYSKLLRKDNQPVPELETIKGTNRKV